MTRPSALSLALLLLSSLAAVGCGSSQAVNAAQKGDYATLKRVLAEKVKAQSLDGGEARAVARAVARYEVSNGKGDDGVKRVDELRACVSPAGSILSDRGKADDEAAARAIYLLLDAHELGPGSWAKKADSTDGAWRAVGARALVSSSQGDARRALFVDLDTRVRRAALGAASEARDAGDLGELLEIVRVDPEPSCRSEAAKAAAEIGGRRVVVSLKDRWSGAEEGVRASIVSAWASERVVGEGGLEQLLWVAETQAGAPAVSAARLLSTMADHEATIGRGALLRAIDDGPTPVRVMAINLSVPTDATHRKSLEKAASSSDALVKVAALSRLSELPDQRDKALAELGTMAASTSIERNPARSALAKARDRRVVPLLAEDLSAPEPGVRAWAANELSSMKEFPQASMALADADVSVRTRAACSIMAMPR